MKILHFITFLLLAIGGLNWGLIGIGSAWTLETLVGMDIAKLLFVLVGVSAVVEIAMHKKLCKMCNPSGAM